jgi:hypothetical protein
VDAQGTLWNGPILRLGNSSMVGAKHGLKLDLSSVPEGRAFPLKQG